MIKKLGKLMFLVAIFAVGLTTFGEDAQASTIITDEYSQPIYGSKVIEESCPTLMTNVSMINPGGSYLYGRSVKVAVNLNTVCSVPQFVNYSKLECNFITPFAARLTFEAFRNVNGIMYAVYSAANVVAISYSLI